MARKVFFSFHLKPNIKRIKNKLEKYKTDELTESILQQLRQFSTIIEKKQAIDKPTIFYPWYLLPLLKLVFLYSNPVFSQRVLTPLIFTGLYNDVFNLIDHIQSDNIDALENELNLHKIYRPLAYQQFVFQKSLSAWQLGR